MIEPRRLHLAVCRTCEHCQAHPKNGGCSGPCLCLINNKDIEQNAADNKCPLNKFKRLWLRRIVRWITYNLSPRRTMYDGSDLWEEIHLWALHGDVNRPLLWLGKFNEKIQCRCCAEGWKKWCQEHPIDITSRNTIFKWTVDGHNHVNVKLKKPEMTLEQAYKRWS